MPELETKMEDITDLAVLGVKLINPTTGEKLDDFMDTFDMIAPKNPLNGGSQSLRPFSNIAFNNFIPTKARLNSALNNANRLSVSSNQPNNAFMNQTLSNVNNIGQSNTKTGVFSTTPKPRNK